MRPVFTTGEDVRCRKSMTVQAQADCLSRGWGWDDSSAQCVTVDENAGETCADDDNLQFVAGECRPTLALCGGLGRFTPIMRI